jgi:hypothetical protein
MSAPAVITQGFTAVGSASLVITEGFAISAVSIGELVASISCYPALSGAVDAQPVTTGAVTVN